MQNDKIIELLSDSNKVEIGGYDKDPLWKLIKFDDGTILYFKQRASDVFDGRWYPDLLSFQYYYDNNYVP